MLGVGCSERRRSLTKKPEAPPVHEAGANEDMTRNEQDFDR
jgi:hypothetical protein